MGHPTVIVEIDSSLTAALREHLESKTSDLKSLLKEFHNLLLKRVSQQRRQVHVSGELAQHSLFKNEKRHVVKKIIATLESGGSLDPYLSEKSEQLQHFDLSLAHFGVHHLHLGEAIQDYGSRAGRIKGTKSLLFARIAESDAYLLDILNHDTKYGFLSMHLLRVMHRNWPKSVEPFRLKGAIGVAVKYSDEEVATLLQNEVNVIVELGREQVYMLPGMGTTTAGTPLLMEQRVDQTLRDFTRVVRMVEHNSACVSDLIKQLTGAGHNIIRLKGRVRAGLLDIYDSTSGCVFTTERENLVVSVPDVL
jgi:hypothetical protein